MHFHFDDNAIQKNIKVQNLAKLSDDTEDKYLEDAYKSIE